MRAVQYDRYGPPEVLELRDVPEPQRPRGGAVRVAVQAAALNPKDVLIRKGRMRWLSGRRFPRVPGAWRLRHVPRNRAGRRRVLRRHRRVRSVSGGV